MSIRGSERFGQNNVQILDQGCPKKITEEIWNRMCYCGRKTLFYTKVVFTKIDVKHFLQSKLQVVSVPCFFSSIGGPAAERNRLQSWLVGVKKKSSVCPWASVLCEHGRQQYVRRGICLWVGLWCTWWQSREPEPRSRWKESMRSLWGAMRRRDLIVFWFVTSLKMVTSFRDGLHDVVFVGCEG